jgi:hypothetical protein
MIIIFNYLVGLCFFMIVEVSFGHPQPTPTPNRPNVLQLHFPRATLVSEFSNTQTTFESGLDITAQPIVVHAIYVECLLVSSALSFCDSASAGFNTLDFSEQALCLCYNSKFWPDGDAASDCDLYFSTQAPSIISQELDLNSLCFTITQATTTSSTTSPITLSTFLAQSPTTVISQESSAATSPIGTPTGSSSSIPTPGPIQSENDIYHHKTCVH